MSESEQSPAAQPGRSEGAGVRAEGLTLRGARGEVYTDIRFDAPPGSLIALQGPSGSGRTCLLLTLTGRMKPSSGSARVGGHPLPQQLGAVRRISALGPVADVTDLEPSLSVAEQLRERALLQRTFGASVRALLRPRKERRATDRSRAEQALAAAGLDPETLPKGLRTKVRDLERLESLRLSTALALMGAPRLLAVDDVDLKLSDAERDEAWALLRSLTEQGLTVVAACSQAPEDALVVSTARARTEPKKKNEKNEKGEAQHALA